MKNKCGCTKKGEEVYPTELVEGHVHKIRCVSVYILWQSTDKNLSFSSANVLFAKYFLTSK